jgi:hypothetical protein
MNEEIYAITNLDGYASDIRDAAAKSLSENNEDNLDNYISIGQIINLVKSNCQGFDMEDRPLVTESINEKIYEDIIIWIHNVGLAKLAAKDLIQCAWDDDNNEMIFWASDKRKSNNGKSRKSKHKNMGDQK